MDYVTRGLYRELLDECWAEGFIPDNLDQLAEICDCPKDVLTKSWQMLSKCFEQSEPGILVNKRMDAERTESDELRVKRSIAGASGGKSRQQLKQVLTSAPPVQASDSKSHIAVAVAVAEHKQEHEHQTGDGILPLANEVLMELGMAGTSLHRRTIADAITLKMNEVNGIQSDAPLVGPSEVADWMTKRARQFLKNNAGTKRKNLIGFFSEAGYDDETLLAGMSLDELRVQAEAKVGAHQ